MCYGMGCRWENYYGECTAPRGVLRCSYFDEEEYEDEPESEEDEEEEEEEE